MEAAKGYLTGCLQSHPELPWLYLLRGLPREIGCTGVRRLTNRPRPEHFAAALADYREAERTIRRRRFRYALLANRGLVRFQCRTFDQAVADLNEAITLDPRQLSACVTLAQVHRYRHHIDSALEELDRAIALQPNLAPLYRTRLGGTWSALHVTSRVRALALADLDRAVQLGTPGSHELAKDHAERAAFSLWTSSLSKYSTPAMLPSRSIPRMPMSSATAWWRSGAEARSGSDRCLRRRSAHGTKVGRFSGAARTGQSQAQSLRGGDRRLHSGTGSRTIHGRLAWPTRLGLPGLRRAAQLALRDFEEAIRLDPSGGEAFSGRGSALVALGRCREAVADAEESLRHGESDVRLHYTAARILALAAESVQKDVRARELAVQTKAQNYQARAWPCFYRPSSALLHAIAPEFRRRVVQPDQAFAALRRLPAYARMAATVSEPKAR